MQSDPELVTGDAVVLELRLARLASRALAFAIDIVVQAVVLLLIVLVITLAGVHDQALEIALSLTALVLVRVGYPVLFETLSGGRTLGKIMFGLRVVRDDGGPIRFRHALSRGLAGAIVDFGPAPVWSVVALVVSLCSAKSKRVGDYLAGTVVIQERADEVDAPLIVMPPALTYWAAQLELSGLSDELALASRQYLARYQQMRPEARDALGSELVNEMAGQITAPWWSPEVPPWAYLMAVLAERRNRIAGLPYGPFQRPS
ncbi:RDD family protein [Amycolatopsis sp.]|uniref:RDD family protein n=1 Tax=Amycolatopsis sp. TaxID=37632 RepID=UPI002BFB4EAF|nr:RDD family protein [Amycolatopsis sp.]HVV10763.1 RDD family protein [Amycolatopsis sp.]